ncbi:MAG: tRNA pseudouridine(38-40) synthase TruA [Bacillota bacterium]
MRNIKLVIEYDGTSYKGWQIQPDVPSIQEELQKAVYRVTGEEVEVIGSGRTDAGVHAKGQVANFYTKSRIPAEKFCYALNNTLPFDIVVKESVEAQTDFHARYSAKGKVYSYTILNSRFNSPILRNFVYHINYCDKLDTDIMKKACECFVGTHDFYGFMAAGSKVKDTVRTIYSIDVGLYDELIKLTYCGNGFLYNMVRIITGTILYTAIGKISLEELPDIISSKNRIQAGITVPPGGLCLEKVLY